MPVPQIQGSKLICRFMGIVALFVDNGRDRFKVGIIKPKEGSDDIKGHKHEIVIRKAKILDDRELYSKSLRLHDGRHRMTKVKQDDSNVTHQGIELFRPQSGGEGRFNREDVVRSFDWVIDIENELHFDEGGNPAAVSINHSSLRSILEIRDIDHGVLFTGESTQAPIFSVESVCRSEARASSIQIRSHPRWGQGGLGVPGWSRGLDPEKAPKPNDIRGFGGHGRN